MLIIWLSYVEIFLGLFGDLVEDSAGWSELILGGTGGGSNFGKFWVGPPSEFSPVKSGIINVYNWTMSLI